MKFLDSQTIFYRGQNNKIGISNKKKKKSLPKIEKCWTINIQKVANK